MTKNWDKIDFANFLFLTGNMETQFLSEVTASVSHPKTQVILNVFASLLQ
jgi:hypothetical protein